MQRYLKGLLLITFAFQLSACKSVCSTVCDKQQECLAKAGTKENAVLLSSQQSSELCARTCEALIQHHDGIESKLKQCGDAGCQQFASCITAVADSVGKKGSGVEAGATKPSEN